MPLVQLSPLREIDVLFVVDDSNNMPEAQRRLASAMDAFVGAFDEDDGAINLRIGFTSTDDGHYWCDEDETDAGQLIASTCRERLDDFVRESTGTEAEDACTTVCPFETIALRPTRIAGSESLSPRPWLERQNGVSNVPEGVSLAEAARCFAPLGIRGCGFEAHLNSMWKALRLSDDSQQAQFGFLRDEALLAIVFVTNESECTSTRALQTVTFGLEGPNTRVFWTLPEQQETPPSAVCWNAGVACDFTLDSEQCRAVDKAVDGSLLPEGDAEKPAMVPMAKYTDFVGQLERYKAALLPGREVIVAGIVGVEPSFSEGDELVYAQDPDRNDPESFGARFGIGPGCDAGEFQAAPPVRLVELSARFSPGGGPPKLFSVCDEDYDSALVSVAESIQEQLHPSCLPICAADGDPDTAGLQPSCAVYQSYFDGNGLAEEQIPRCSADGNVPPGQVACHLLVTDEMHEECVEKGANLEVRVVFAPGTLPNSGALYRAECTPSENGSVDCPELPG